MYYVSGNHLGSTTLITPDPFVLGGIAFLICHLFYILAFCQLNIPTDQLIWYLTIMIVYLSIGIMFYKSFVQDFWGLNKFIKMGIGMYVLVILMMSFSSTWLLTSDKPISFVPWFGSLLFILSDYLLAMGYKTNRAFSYYPWVMACYLTGQLLIIIGFILLGS